MNSIPSKSEAANARKFFHPWTAFKRYSSIYMALWKNSIVREMGFKSNFLLWIVVDMLWFALQLCFMTVIFRHTESIGTWSKWEVVMLMGAAQFIQQIFSAIFFLNLTQLSEHIRTGRLDFMLLLPVNSRFLLSFRQVDLGGFVNAATGAAVVVYAARQLGVVPTQTQLLGFGMLALTGILIHYSLMLTLATTSFWTVRAQGIVWGYYNLFHLSRLPDAAFRGLFKAFFTYAIPMILVANVPTKILVGKLSNPWEAFQLLLLSLLCFAVSEMTWRYSIRHYTSASS